MWSRGVLVAALVALVLGGLAVVALTRDGTTPPRAVPAAEVARATGAAPPACADLLVLGLDGNGEKAKKGKRWGPTVDRAVATVVAASAARGRTVDKRVVAMRTAPASALVASRTSTRPARSQVGRARAVAWARPVPGATRRAQALVDAAARTCSDQQLLLVGHAQGAAVAHRLLRGLAARAGAASRVVGAVLVSDPERVARTRAARVGAPAAPRKSQAVLPAVGRRSADVPRGTDTSRTWSVCTRGDLVCAPSSVPVRRALAISHSYARGKGARVVARAADALAALAARRPVPDPREQVVAVTAGTAVSVQLAVSATPALGAGAVAWRATGALPAGLALSPTGLLSGTASAAGLTTTPYAVRGTSPVTSEAVGRLTVRVVSSTDAVAAGGRTACEIHADGTAWCWGGNQWGQVGDGTTTERHAPVQVGTATDWKSIDTSGSATCAVKTGGTLWCWGLNTDGQLGLGADNQRVSPVQVGTATTWAQVSTGWHHTCAVRTDGTLWCWGLDASGQLGLGNRSVQTRPAQVAAGTDWTQVQVGGFFTCGLRVGTAWCWGGNGFGQLGRAPGDDALSPVAVPGPTGLVSMGASWGTVCATSTTGRAWCWGRNDRSQLGNGATADTATPTAVAGTQTWTSIAVGDSMACGIDATGRGWCWGDGRYGQLGAGSAAPSGVPVKVASDVPWTDVEAGWFSGCAAQVTGRTACWGNNELGQVGDGGTANVTTPKEIP